MPSGEYMNIRVPPELKAELIKLAKLDDRTLSSYVKQVLRKWVEKQK